jgi:hypothetical protein
MLIPGLWFHSFETFAAEHRKGGAMSNLTFIITASASLWYLLIFGGMAVCDILFR